MKKNNKGFSLVELIIVIAIMAVLVGVLAPQFIKYVEQSRRSRDIQTANELREAALADVADGVLTGSSNITISPVSGDPSNINETPSVAGNKVASGSFSIEVNPNSGTCSVKVGTFDLTTEAGASAYKVP
jgi:type IV pilus assembly protein PilA